MFELLGVRPVGRAPLLGSASIGPATDDVVLITDRLWGTPLRSRPRDLGRTIRLDDRPRTVVGVLPDTADLGILQWLLAADYSRGFADRDARSRVDAWVPLPLDPTALAAQHASPAGASGAWRRRSIAAAQDEMAAVMAALEREYPDDNKARGAHVEAAD